MLASTLLIVASRWGEALLAGGLRMKVHTPPLRGPTDWRPGGSALVASIIAVAMIVVWPRVALRLRWSTLLAVAAGTAVAWALALALIDGVGAITDPLRSEGQYLNTVHRVGELGGFLTTFNERIADYNIHTQGHPPGMVTMLWLLDAVGLGGVRWNAVLVFLGGATAVVATLVTVRAVASEGVARRAAPFLVLAPAAIWWSSADAFFAGVAAVAVMLVVLATDAEGRRADLLAAAGGVAFASTAYLSYGLVLLGLVPVTIAWRRRHVRPLLVALSVAVALVGVVSVTSGFLWWDGLAATRARYFAGVARHRPYGYFLVANLAVFAVAVGPAAVAGIARLRRDAFGYLVGAALAVVLLADVSGMSKAEVERIWLPFVPLVVAAAGSMVRSVRSVRWWLGAQAVVTLVVAVGIRSPW